jgi:nucleotide-binding universal stress UspA family protein
MPVLHDRTPVKAPPAAEPGRRRRPVVLATLSVRVDPEAEQIAIDSALETDAPLIVANLFWLPPCPGTVLRGEFDAVREAAARASARGIRTELLMQVCCRGPLRALLALARERDAGLVVLGPDRRRTGRRRLRTAAKTVCDGLDCLVWTAADN